MKMHELPDERGHFGRYGGGYVAETLVHALDELKRAYEACRKDPEFVAEFAYELKHYVGRPSPVYHAKRWSQMLGGAQIYIKREDLNHTGAHKINNTVGQALVARRMGKPRVIAETGAGMHGVAAATVAARYGMECVVYMGSEDIKRQVQNVYRMKLLGAAVVPVESGSKTLKDALNEAMRDWVTHVDNTFYIIGTVAGPHPYPMMVRDFQSVIGRECLTQMPELCGRQPDAVIACVGGGSNAMGIFYPYIPYEAVKLIGVEAGGLGIASGKHAASLCAGRPGVLHGNRTYLLQDEHGQIIETHSISAGLDYPGVGPEHAWLKDTGRAEYVTIDDDPPYGLGKDYGNDSDCLSGEAYLAFSRRWIDAVIPKLKPSGSLYVFLTWQHSPEVFSYLKTRLTMVNEIVWDRKVPSMGGSTRKFSSVHDTIGLFACSKEYFFDIDSVRIPYDAETKRARTRSIFVGKKWLEVGYNPKDVWSVTRIHRQDPERENHPTQKPLEIVERMVLASCPPEGLVLDPFMGSGTVAVAALKHGRSFVGFEINPKYCALAKHRVGRLRISDLGAGTSPVRSAAAL